MDSINVKAPAKLNLFLDITGKLDNGYHSVRSVMQSIDYFDYVKISKNESGKISVKCSVPALDGESNIAYKAAELFLAETGIEDGVDIFIDKRIPMEAGLAGGSADAAAVIWGMNLIFETGYSNEKLCEIGSKCGADIPFSIIGSTMLSEGIGNELSPLSTLLDCFFVVVKPKAGMSTKESYVLYDEHEKELPHGDFSSLSSGLEHENIDEISASLFNVLESVVPGNTIEKAKQRLIDCGALGSSMTGSGTAVFGIFDDEKLAVSAFNTLNPEYPESFIARPTNYGVAVDKSAKVTERLDKLGISYRRIDHCSVYTMEEMDLLGIFGDGVVGKNLFLRDAKGKRHFLVFVYGDKKVNLSQIEEKIGIKHCSFGSPERLDKYLGLTKGSVSPLGVVNDVNAEVEFIIDRDFIGCPCVGVHPNQNTSTLWLSFSDLEKVIKSNGNQITYVEI